MKVLVMYVNEFSYVPAVKNITDTEEILEGKSDETAQTPLGYFLDLKIDAPGYSLARIWASL